MAKMFGKYAYELVQEMLQCPPDALPPFNADGLLNALDEVQHLAAAMSEAYDAAVASYREELAALGRDPSGPDAGDPFGPEGAPGGRAPGTRPRPAAAAELLAYHHAILRNKRALLAYARARLERLQALRWRGRALPPGVAANLSPAEAEFFRRYDRLLAAYGRAGGGGVGLDLTADAAPPADPCVQVRVLRDAGAVALEGGALPLRRGASHWLPRDEAHALVMDGVIEVVGG